jgi:hypothetical protein
MVFHLHLVYFSACAAHLCLHRSSVPAPYLAQPNSFDQLRLCICGPCSLLSSMQLTNTQKIARKIDRFEAAHNL